MNYEPNRLLHALSREIIEALAMVLQKRQPLDADTLSENLLERAEVIKLLSSAGLGGSIDNSEIKSKNYDKLSVKYNQILQEMNQAELRFRDLEEALKGLANILIIIAGVKDEPSLGRELGNIRHVLKGKPDASAINASICRLKEILFKLENKDIGLKMEGIGEASGGRPEGIEENLRDILTSLVKEISNFEDETLQGQADGLVAKISSDFSLDNFEPFVHEINELIFHFKELVQKEREELYLFSEEIMIHLQETENDLFKTLDLNRERFEMLETDFSDRVAEEMSDIERVLQTKGLSLEDVRSRVLERISSIRRRFREVRAQDEARIKMAEVEKGAVRRRLDSVHKRYQEFTARSQAQLLEMEKFRQASMRDDLTGVFNRRAYDFQIKQALADSRDGKISGFCLIIFDVDNFREFNNNYGHRAGDKILTHVTRLSRDAVRSEDFIARYGGDEFVLVLPEVGLEDAVRLAEKIRKEIGEVEFKIYRDQEITVNITISLGVAINRDQDSPKSIFVRADKALYKAKEMGRNQVVVEAA